jgi:hypothetical protein
VIVLVRIILGQLADLVGLIALSVRPRRSVEAENPFLRRELALYKERGVKPRRVDAVTRVSLAFLSRLVDWRDALVVRDGLLAAAEIACCSSPCRESRMSDWRAARVP